ncbi:MAG: 50S ribosomal protein L11 methyltransferase, partial [Flavihumibacter sp.]|nr:50S ribosomal protein L11 methyltransferase [Flavihumibacter sp.]
MTTGNYYKISFITPDAATKEICIALLSNIGFEGFEEDRTTLHGFIPVALLDEQQLAALLQQQNISYTKSIIENRNWNEEWESGFTPVLIGNFCQVRASFHAANPAVKHDIIINPKMSFGTGHHATTWLMIEAMSELAIEGMEVFDFGTGTGVLAILAAQMKAAAVTAIDNDEWSINNAAENFELNNAAGIVLQNASSMMVDNQYNLILA